MVRPLTALLIAATAMAGSLVAQEQAPNRRQFSIVARDHAFVPARLQVSQDDLIKITFTAEGRPASFALDAYRIVKRAAGGQTIAFEFRADQPGTFTFYCNLTSDAECRDMKGTLIVNPR